MKSTLTEISVRELKLDLNNPRFAELYSGSENEDELIEYLLYNESAEDVAKGIVNAGEFYPDRPLWVIKRNGNYLVKDGNRRCAAVKALKHPSKYGMELPKKKFSSLPVLLYKNEEDINSRILLEHTNSLFREWDRIAKALEVYKMYSSGSSLEIMKEIDSQPSQLIKLASFYYAAVKVAGDDLKRLLRRGRGKSGGKTIIFERLFSYSRHCGYSFRNKPSYKIVIRDKSLFEKYIKALVRYLQENPKTKTQDVDKKKEKFLKNLKDYGFEITKRDADSGTANVTTNGTSHESHSGGKSSSGEENDSTNGTSSSNSSSQSDSGSSRKSIKTKPIYTRKRIPPTLEKLIKECYSIDANYYPNAKTALTRVTFECALKYVIENTKHNGKTFLCNSNYFRNVFYDRNNNKKTFTDFSKLKNLFTELILSTGIKKAFENFEIERTHQIIHNYYVGATYSDATGLCDNLIPLLEFLLQDENDFVNSIEKLKL